jgi:hypothetical protein
MPVMPQQPPEQLVLSQTQVPLTQCRPGAHGAPVDPQTQLPLLHVSAVMPQSVQVAPLVPHVEVLEVWQWPLVSQQPLGQLVLSQTHAPLTHS